MLLIVVFGAVAAVAVASSIMVITARQPVPAVLWFVPAIWSVAGLLALAGAWTLSVLLVLVYAGAVVVPFAVLAVMQGLDLLDGQQAIEKHKRLTTRLALVLGAEGALVVLAALLRPADTRDPMPSLADSLVADHMALLPLTALVLVAALAGAVRLTLREGALRVGLMDRLQGRRSALGDAGPGQGA